MLRGMLAFTVVAAAPFSAAQENEAKPGEVKLEVVKYEGLKAAVLKHRGKVVYVDFWFYNCVPCKIAMPHLVDLYAKHHKAGLEVITVNVNFEGMSDEENFKKSLEFLQSKKAVFKNVI